MSFFQFPAREYKKKFKLLIPLPLIAQFTISPCSHFQTTAQIRNQLGQGPDPAPLQGREILQLEKKPSWIADASDLPPVEPFVRDFANVPRWRCIWSGRELYRLPVASHPAESADCSTASIHRPDSMHIWLVQEVVSIGASVAFALQSIITVLSSMAYLDQLAQFNNNQTAEVD
jgi:hypothetical protein